MRRYFPLFALLIAAVFAVFAVVRGFPTAAAQTASTTASDGSAASATATANASGSLQQQLQTNDQQIAALNAEIAADQAALQQAGADKKTLQAAINALDLQRNQVQTQVALTQLQIQGTQLQIKQLGGEIADTSATIATDQETLGAYLRILQKNTAQPLLVQVLSSNDITQIWSDVNATLQVQSAVQQQMQTLQLQKSTLTSSQTATQQKQTTLASQQEALATQQQNLVATVQEKNQLLLQTNAKESTYQKLLAAAQAQLQSFTAFTQNAGGSKLLGSQTACDAWGCYYNQRDALWGNIPLDGTKYNLASDGCLITAMAMVMTHYGYRDVTPVTINSNPSNFAAYYPAALLYTINVDGISATRKTTAIDATLATGNPVIVGINAYGGTHYVVLVSGSKGNYIMRDPYIANGKDISFTGSYSVRSIFGISKVVVSA